MVLDYGGAGVAGSLQNSKTGDLVLVQGNLPSAASERKSSSYSNIYLTICYF